MSNAKPPKRTAEMPVLLRRDAEENSKIGLVIGLVIGTLIILALVYLLCSQMLAPSSTKKRRCKKHSHLELGEVRVHRENGHKHEHRHERIKRHLRKSRRKHKRTRRHRECSAYSVVECHGANGSGIPGVDFPEIINVDGNGVNTQIPAVVVNDVPPVEVLPTIEVPQVPVAGSEPFIVVNEPMTDGAVHIVRRRRKHRCKKRKARNRGGCFGSSGKRSKKRRKRGTRTIDLGDFTLGTVRRGRERGVVMAQEPIYQEVIQAV